MRVAARRQSPIFLRPGSQATAALEDLTNDTKVNGRAQVLQSPERKTGPKNDHQREGVTIMTDNAIPGTDDMPLAAEEEYLEAHGSGELTVAGV